MTTPENKTITIKYDNLTYKICGKMLSHVTKPAMNHLFIEIKNELNLTAEYISTIMNVGRHAIYAWAKDPTNNRYSRMSKNQFNKFLDALEKNGFKIDRKKTEE